MERLFQVISILYLRSKKRKTLATSLQELLGMRMSDLHRLRPVDDLGTDSATMMLNSLRSEWMMPRRLGSADLFQDHIQAILRIGRADLVELGAVDKLHRQGMSAHGHGPGNGNLRVELFHDLVLVPGGKSGGIKPGHLGLVGEVVAQAAHVLEAGPPLAVELDGQGDLAQCP